MTRELDAANVTASRADVYGSLLFASLGFDPTPGNPGGTLYLHNGIGIYTWGGDDWYGVGDFGSISAVQETAAISPYSLELGLSGIDSILVNEALNEDYYLRPVALFLGFLDDGGSLVADPDEIWSGKMVKMTMALGEQNAIALQCESDLADMERSNGKRFNDSDQQTLHVGDTFFRWQSQVERLKLQWGGRNSVPYSGAGDVNRRRTRRRG